MTSTTQTTSVQRRALIASLIRDIPDFPQQGVGFKDITPLLGDAAGFRATIDELVATAPAGIDVVVGMEARGFIVGAPVAIALGAGFVPVRKPGKLPAETYEVSYDLEYGSETLTIHTDAIKPGSRVLVVDDVLATGGTLAATAGLIQRLGAELVHVSVLMELAFLQPRQLLARAGLGETAITALVTVAS
ncbi:adenine phosphoribosyltransferase [Raineyella fluvialis]|uniref:Adenine phosphoribosyltransferase n=1 Tax=Raineyella fluvialis TaxID=2662261 RepID=A0A5Q2FHB4_9ACTN|nr:adenine phosphoribosyltransferase [Raineyella fluvialis]QGF24513.1 adenine phosphoribosyltransferase [Raineyella fluvialis]